MVIGFRLRNTKELTIMRGINIKIVNIILILLVIVTTQFYAVNIVKASDYIILNYVNTRQAMDGGDTFYGKSVAQLIYDESVQHDINPRLILTILQRESSAITQTTPSSTTREAWPMFYNYDERMASCINGDVNSCNDTKYNKPTYEWRSINYGGIGQQIAYATYNFGLKYSQYSSTYSSPITIDGVTINCSNAATRALYAYTPHLSSYNSSSSFYTNWSTWWEAPPTGNLSNNEVITNENYRGNIMSVGEIQNFLISKGSWLATYGPNGLIPEYVSVPYPAVNNSEVTGSNDTADYSRDSYDNSLSISGGKASNNRAYYGGTLLADLNTTSWNLSFEPQHGGYNYYVDYKDTNGTIVARKKMYIIRHKIADINGDGRIDIIDLAILAENWNVSNPSNRLVDFNGDNVVNIADLAILAEKWGW